MNVQLERSREALAAPNDVDVIFTTKERGKYFLKTSTEVGNNEGNAVRKSWIDAVLFLY